jgi:glycine/sarcosine N-methyltransferase
MVSAFADRPAGRRGFSTPSSARSSLAPAADSIEVMTPDPTPAEFYDELADEYHLIFADWDASIARQARVITGLLHSLGLASGAVLDASCGIGTQAIGLARAGFSVTATDISRASVERCAREAAARGLTMATAVADLRVLDVDEAGDFDAAVSFDNALPHLLDDADLNAACAALRRVLRPGGVLLVSIRDYDEVLRQRPSGDLPRRYATESGERIVFQVWDWLSDDRYTVRHFIMEGNPGRWRVTERTTTYRALSRAALSDALRRAGFDDVVWQMPPETGFYQPVVAARANRRV